LHREAHFVLAAVLRAPCDVMGGRPKTAQWRRGLPRLSPAAPLAPVFQTISGITSAEIDEALADPWDEAFMDGHRPLPRDESLELLPEALWHQVLVDKAYHS
jgi:hypothetical protein